MTTSRRTQVRRALEVARKLQADRAAAQAQSASASSDWLTAWERRRDEQEIDR